MANVGEEVFSQQVTARFGLVLTDESVRSIACDLGWSDEWLQTKRTRAKAAMPKSGDIAVMFGNPPVPPPNVNGPLLMPGPRNMPEACCGID